jgi:predicted nucleic acid-binding protein
VTETIAERWAHIAASTRKRGLPPAVVDGIIAATAIELSLTLVTRNVKDYGSLGLALLNPWEET